MSTINSTTSVKPVAKPMTIADFLGILGEFDNLKMNVGTLYNKLAAMDRESNVNATVKAVNGR